MILRFCGSTDEYCLPCHGCQSGCSSGSSCPVASTPTPTPAPSLTTGQKNGIIIGTVLFAALLAVLGLLYFCYKERTKRQLLTQSGRATFTVEFPPGTAGADLLRQVAGNGNPPFLLAPPNRTYSPYDRGSGRIYGPPSSHVGTLPA
jgi:hypothetical protein